MPFFSPLCAVILLRILPLITFSLAFGMFLPIPLPCRPPKQSRPRQKRPDEVASHLALSFLNVPKKIKKGLLLLGSARGILAVADPRGDRVWHACRCRIAILCLRFVSKIKWKMTKCAVNNAFAKIPSRPFSDEKWLSPMCGLGASKNQRPLGPWLIT